MSIAILYEQAETDELGIRMTAQELGIDVDHYPLFGLLVAHIEDHGEIPPEQRTSQALLQLLGQWMDWDSEADQWMIRTDAIPFEFGEDLTPEEQLDSAIQRGFVTTRRGSPVSSDDSDDEYDADHDDFDQFLFERQLMAGGLAAMLADPPSLVILDLMMPDMDGFAVLDQMRADERTRRVPVVILSGRQLSLSDVERLEQHAAVTLQSKGILSEDEIIASLHRSLFDTATLPPQTSALAKRAIAYLHQNYARPLARWEIAEGIGVNEDYLSRVFNRELGISP